MNKLHCSCCGAATLSIVLDLGEQAPSNRFLASPCEQYDTHNLILCNCSTCGIAQLHNPMPVSMVSCRHPFLTYNEPEAHLDELSEKLVALLPHPKAHVSGLSYKDASLLERINAISDVNIIDIHIHDMGLDKGEKGIEKIQEQVNAKFSQKFVQHSEKLDMLIVRHMLEHAHSPRTFMDACTQIVKEGGLIVFEVPNCEKIFQSQAHCFIWEEHTLYFTRHSIQNFFQLAGHEILFLDNYPYPLEDALVVVVKNSVSAKKIAYEPTFDMELQDFKTSFVNSTQLLADYFQHITVDGEKIPIFGAGHLAMKFINFYKLANWISVVIDDHPSKKGLFLPISGLEIVTSQFLEDEIPQICLLSLNPESEKKVISAQSKYIEKGGKFLSIFSLNKNLQSRKKEC